MFRASKMFSSPFSRSSIFIPKVNSLISIASASFRLESHQLRNTCITIQTSGFHSSAYVAAKKTKAVAGEGVVVADIVLPDTKLMDAQMEKKMVRIIDEFMKLRSGQVNTEVFRSVMVDSGGSRLSVADSGQISVKSPTKMSISVFDPSLVVLVADAIRDSGMGLNPTVEGNSVLMSMPKPSKEAKEALVRSARIIADRVSLLRSCKMSCETFHINYIKFMHMIY
jgi:Ribosome recycling factor